MSDRGRLTRDGEQDVATVACGSNHSSEESCSSACSMALLSCIFCVCVILDSRTRGCQVERVLVMASFAEKECKDAYSDSCVLKAI